jgi:hypothetical protein
MSKRKHHFVPRFYLNAFSSAPRRIHVYNLDRESAIEDVSLRDQCYRRRFYGETDEIEDWLAQAERQASQVIHSIVKKQALPPNGSAEYSWLIAFVALQLQRTTAAARRIDLGADKLWKTVLAHDPRVAQLDLDQIRIGVDQPILVALHALRLLMWGFEDLETQLVRAPVGQFFLASDNPVFRYNQYCEGVAGIGVLGALSRGLQIFLPLSPRLTIMLYDKDVYKAGRKGKRISRNVPPSDVGSLNLLQVVGAHQNIYFSDWSHLAHVQALVRRGIQYRSSEPVHVQEFFEEGDEEQSSLLHLYEDVPDLGLRLSFVRIRRHPLRVPKFDRVRLVRKEIPELGITNPRSQESSGETRVFYRMQDT